MTNILGQTVPLRRTLVGKSSLAKRFSYIGWDRECGCIRGGTELSGRIVSVKEIGKIDRPRVKQGGVGESGDLVLNSGSNGEPVEGTKKGGYVITFSCLQDKTGSIILYPL